VSFRCPTCRDPLAQETEHLVCRRCERHYPLVRGIPDFRTESGYWCNVSRQVLRELVDDARTSGDWRAAANRHVPDYVEHFTSRGRADFRFLLPLDRTSVVLDAGAMWGGITVPMAPEAGTVYAVDKTLETIEFLDLRAKQSGLGNVRVCACGLDKLPFQDGFFDIVILSGVLEWVAVDEETVLARDYFQPRHDRRSYGLAPERVQTDVLTELRRVLKATGVLCLAIENRYGLPYFLGKPDDHVNVRFVPLLPRRLANLVTQWRLNSPYRTYTHSDRALRSMLGEAGFDTVKVMGCSPHYIEPDFICNQVRARYYLRKHRHRLGRKYGLMSRLLPASLLSKTIPSFVVLAGGANGTQTEQAKLARANWLGFSMTPWRTRRSVRFGNSPWSIAARVMTCRRVSRSGRPTALSQAISARWRATPVPRRFSKTSARTWAGSMPLAASPSVPWFLPKPLSNGMTFAC